MLEQKQSTPTDLKISHFSGMPASLRAKQAHKMMGAKQVWWISIKNYSQLL